MFDGMHRQTASEMGFPVPQAWGDGTPGRQFQPVRAAAVQRGIPGWRQHLPRLPAALASRRL